MMYSKQNDNTFCNRSRKVVLFFYGFLFSISFSNANGQQQSTVEYPKVSIPLHVIFTREDDGSGDVIITEDKFHEVLKAINDVYAEGNIQFYVCGDIDYVNASILYSDPILGSPEKNEAYLSNCKSHKINIFMTNANLGSSFVVKIENRRLANINYSHIDDVLFHELGHYIGLDHTHTTAQIPELVDNSQCMLYSDKLCDTPADPLLSGKVSDACIYNNSAIDPAGNYYDPDVFNIMSYTNDMCSSHFSPGQFQQMHAYIEENLSDFKCGLPVEAKFSSEVKSACINQPIQLYSESIGEVSHWNWSATNGTFNNSSIENPIVSFNSTGSKSAQLTITHTTGSDTKQVPNYFTIINPSSIPILENFEGNLEDYEIVTHEFSDVVLSEGKNSSQGIMLTAKTSDYLYKTRPTPEAFDGNHLYLSKFIMPCINTSGQNALSLSFDYKLTHETTSLNTNFRVTVNGIPVTSTIQSIENNENWKSMTIDLSNFTNQILRVSFEAICKKPYTIANGGNAVFIDNINLTESITPSSVTIDFSANKIEACEEESVTFTSSIQGIASNYSWNFGAHAIPSTALGSGPHLVTYKKQGKKTIELTVTTSNGNKVLTKNNYLTINLRPSVYWSEAPTEVCQGTVSIYSIYPKQGYQKQVWTNPGNDVLSNNQNNLSVNWQTPTGEIFGIETSDKGCVSAIDTIFVQTKQIVSEIYGASELCAHENGATYSIIKKPNVKINEISVANIGFDPSNPGSQDIPNFDWIEFKNFSNNTIDISNWRIEYTTDVSMGGTWMDPGLKSLNVYTGDKVLSPGEITVIQGATTKNNFTGWNPVLSIERQGYIALYDNTNTLVDFIQLGILNKPLEHEAVSNELWNNDGKLSSFINYEYVGYSFGSTSFVGQNTSTKNTENSNAVQINWSGTNTTLSTPYANAVVVSSDWGIVPGDISLNITGPNVVCSSNIQSKTVNILNNNTMSISINASSSAVCVGEKITFTSSIVNGGESSTYQWKVNGVNKGSNAKTFTLENPVHASIVTLEVSNAMSCILNNTAVSNEITLSVGQPLLPEVSIITNKTNFCIGEAITFVATPMHGGENPRYNWLVNDIVKDEHSAVFTTLDLEHGDVIKAIITSNASCVSNNSAISNEISMTSTSSLLPVSVTIQVTEDTICSNDSPVFSIAQSQNITGNIKYQWYNGDTPLTNGIQDSYQYSFLPNEGNHYLKVYTEQACVSSNPVISNKINLTVLYSNSGQVILEVDDFACEGEGVTFYTTSQFPGENPVYKWYKNDIELSDEHNSTYTTNTLSSNDEIMVTMESSWSCISHIAKSRKAKVEILENCLLPTIKGIKDISVAIYPNPHENYFYVKSSEPFIATIINTNGLLLFSQSCEKEVMINSSEWSSGLYLLQLNYGNRIESRKVIKK